MITRFAPTPSGFLHEGNAANALLVSWLAAQIGADVALRVDDLDAARLRPAYVQDIFETLSWLGITWSIGPRTPAELATGPATPDRVARYRDAITTATGHGLDVYACRCSRRVLDGPAIGGCPAGCQHLGLAYVPGETTLRAHIPVDTVVEVDGRPIHIAATAGDVVLWRRDDLPAYHLASVVDDRDLGTTHIVRGADLVESTALQRFLAPFLDAPGVADAVYVHHALVTGPDGAKLSKSQIERGAPLPRTAEERDRIRRIAVDLGTPVGITAS